MSANRESKLLMDRKPTPEQWEMLRRAQAIARKFLPEGVSLSDELIADRRAAAEDRMPL